ncbi:hypothetical protein B23_3652 [Geobacillus thermoleovorans B23]|nr:hypothetical protein B23_3652 [Geobacillus thermoleovorans B23]
MQKRMIYKKIIEAEVCSIYNIIWLCVIQQK